MRSGFLLTTLIGLASASHIAAAATSGTTDLTWAAYGALENGMTTCAGATIPAPEWAWATSGQVDIKGNTLTFTTASRAPNSSFTVDLKGLQPDGSGRIVAKDSKNRTFYLTLAPGSGPRPFDLTYSYNACRRVYTPTRSQ